ncbi:hypothetical protein D6774_02105 [Candidatus Woesearchaeota archaeon]|nr:MAG: hypothetical protein D6774_02105 [Candidatus Woesearchaeota archaeon]
MKSVFTLLVALLLMGCIQQTIITQDEGFHNVSPLSPQERADNQDDHTKEFDTQEPKIQENNTVPTTNPTSKAPVRSEIDASIRELIQTGQHQEKNYFYLLRNPALGPGQFKVWVRDENMFIIPPSGYLKEKYNRIYVNRANKTAVAYCRESDGLQCKDFGPFELNYTTWNLITPHDWLEEMNHAVYFADSTFSRRPVAVVQETRNNTTYLVLLDRFYGIPLKILKGEDQVLVEFSDLLPGRVSKDIVKPNLNRVEHLS